MYSTSLSSLALLGATLAVAKPYAYSPITTTVLLPRIFNESSVAEDISVTGGLDGVKLTPGVNDTAFDW